MNRMGVWQEGAVRRGGWSILKGMVVKLAFFSLQSDKNHCGDIYSRNLSDIFKFRNHEN